MTQNTNHILQKNEIKICYWNIHGKKSEIIKDKLLDPEFIKMLNNSDIVSLSELHTDDKDLFIPGYLRLKQKIRNKTHKGPKIGGGIAVFAREDIFDSTHVVPNNNENSIWIKLKNKSSKGRDLFIGSYYVSPENKKSKQNLFDILSEEYDRFGKLGNVILVGDFNARTGQKIDFIQPDPFLENLLDSPLSNCGKALPPRNSEDNGTNTRGDELLDFCKTNEFAIVNGRKIGDLFGKCTSHQYNGSSAVDFLLTPANSFENISYFKVGDYIPWLSDHSPILADIELDIDAKKTETPIPLHKRDQGYVWDDDCEENFKAFLSYEREVLENMNLTTTQNSDANELAKTIKDSILKASKKCNLKKKANNEDKKIKPWFDKECSDIKRKLTEIGKKLRCDKGNEDLRRELFEMKKKLKKTARNKKRQHKKKYFE